MITGGGGAMTNVGGGGATTNVAGGGTTNVGCGTETVCTVRRVDAEKTWSFRQLRFVTSLLFPCPP